MSKMEGTGHGLAELAAYLREVTAIAQSTDKRSGQSTKSNLTESHKVKVYSSSSNTGAGETGDMIICPPGKDLKEIWSKDEVDATASNVEEGAAVASLREVKDPRPTPEYNVFYRQSVKTEDIFLQLGNKHNGTASCENLVVEILLPGEKTEDIEMNIQKQELNLQSPKFCLNLCLPHPVDPRAGNAKWDSEKEKLTVTLKLNRELDELNF